MSGLYNMVLGVNEAAGALLAMLGLNPAKVPRFRDCWWDGTNIVLHTRTGGGNREYYESKESCEDRTYEGPFNTDLRKLPTYVRDEDDSFDCTYANFYYTLPPEYEHLRAKLPVQGKTAAERWQEAIEAIKKGPKS